MWAKVFLTKIPLDIDIGSILTKRFVFFSRLRRSFTTSFRSGALEPDYDTDVQSPEDCRDCVLQYGSY